MTHDLPVILAEAIRIARGAGAILREGHAQIEAQRECVAVTYKADDVDPVTEYDHRSEAFIVAELQRAFPFHGIVGEEGGSYEVRSEKLEVAQRVDGSHFSLLTSHFEWQVDPLDGTVNFAHGFPIFSVSLGLLVDGAPALGVVYNPIYDELFAGARGCGATLNGRPIRVSPTPSLSRALLNTGFPYDRRTSAHNNFDAFLRFQRASQEVRRVGSAALDLCWVACGRMDGYWEMKIKPHDISAGIAIAREAGATVTDYLGGDAMLTRSETVASNGLIHQEMLDVIRNT
jgi:myo-inositol-1(or 4)-monophosphatase